MQYDKLKVIIFDLDGTLTESKQPIDAEMTALLLGLLKDKSAAVISGSWFPQFERQLLFAFESSAHLLNNLFIFPANATVCYRYNGGWQKAYEEGVLSEEKKQHIKNALHEALQESGFVAPVQIYGEQMEDRITQISFSSLGQDAPLHEKQEWNAMYNELRMATVSRLKELLPEFEVRAGGLTTIDVTRKGIDKAYGVRKILEYTGAETDETLFIGDALYPGGNDEPARQTGVTCVQVSGPEELKDYLRRLR